jgi:Lipopolysaccharide biosynthesis proteins, LPS:glycosyltransferases
MRTLNILYQSSDYYAPITGVSLLSLLENNKDIEVINTYLLDDSISEENKQKLKSICDKYGRNICIIDTKETLKELKALKVKPFNNSYTTYFKLIEVGRLDLTTDRILQLDGDTIITGSLKELCDMDLGDCVYAATYDCTMNGYKALIDIPLTDKYYNGGVMLFNVPKWKSEGCFDKIVDHLTNVRNNYYTVDQDISNVLFRDKVKYIDLKFNFNSGFFIYGVKESLKMYGLKPDYYNTVEEVENAMKDVRIYHCMGAMTGRPWEAESIHPQNELFDKYLAMSPWHDMEKQKVTRSAIFRMQKKLYQILPRALYIPIHKMGQRYYLNKMNAKVKKEA